MNPKRRQEIIQAAVRYGYFNLAPLSTMKTLWFDLSPTEALVEHERLLVHFLAPLVAAARNVTLIGESGANPDLLRVFPHAVKRGKLSWAIKPTGEDMVLKHRDFWERALLGREARGAALMECEHRAMDLRSLFHHLYDPTVITNVAAYSSPATLRRARQLVQGNNELVVVGILARGFKGITFFACGDVLRELAGQACEAATLSLNCYHTDPP